MGSFLWKQCYFFYSLSPSLDGGGSLCLCAADTPEMGPQRFPIVFITFLSVFKEKPKYPPSRAQSLSYALATTDASYLGSIARLFKNLNFVLLVITYGKAYKCPAVPGTSLMCLCFLLWLFRLTLGPLHILRGPLWKSYAFHCRF